MTFVEQEEVFLRVIKRIEALEKGYRQNVGLVGPKGRGKTTTLRSLFAFLQGKPNYLVMYLDARTMDYDQFVDRWIGALLTSVFLSQAVKPPAAFQALLSAADLIVPRTVGHVRQLKKMIRRGKLAASVRELFASPGILAEETGKKMILMVDEFQALESLPVNDPFGLFGREMMVEKDTLYLVTSSSPVRAHMIFKEKLSLLFGNFEVVESKPLGFRETSAYVSKQLPGRVFTNAQKKFIIRLTDGNPIYLRLLVDCLGRAPQTASDAPSFSLDGSASRSLTTVELIEAFCEELSEPVGRIAFIFKRRLDACRFLAKDPSTYVKVLLAVGYGRRKILSIATFVGKKVREMKKILHRLVQEDMLAKKGSFYVLEDPLFRFWLCEVFQKRGQLYTPDFQAVREGLSGSLQEMFREVEEEEGMDIAARVQALFKEFRNDVVELDHKRVRLPQFSEIAFRPTNGRVFPLLARNPKVRWLCQIAHRLVGEEDVAAFVEDLKKFRKNVQRRIMVTLAGIDQNAKLMAQEAKIQLWDLRNFNALLDLYDLPKVIMGYDEENDESDMGAVAHGVHPA